MFRDLDKKIKNYSYISVVSGIFVCFLLIVGAIYLSMNSYAYNIINPDGSVLSIPYWPLILLAIVLCISWYSIMLCVHGVGEILERLNDFERYVKEENDNYEKEQLSTFITNDVKEETTVSAPSSPVVLNSVNDPVVVNRELFNTDTTNKEIEDDLKDGVADYLVTDKIEDTMDIENKLIFEDVKEQHNYRLDLSNAFFNRLKSVGLSSTQERAVYENVELALLTNENLVLTTTTEEGQKVNVSIPTDTLGHVADNIETYKDALKIFRKLKTIQVAKDFIWKM